MTDIRSRLAECVACSWFETQTTLGEMGMKWDRVPQEVRDNSVTNTLPIADALLSLPGITIVDWESPEALAFWESLKFWLGTFDGLGEAK